MLHWQIEELHLELKYTWKISRNASDFKRNSLVTVSNGRWEGSGEGAPNIRYNETPEIMQSEFHRFLSASPEQVHDLEDLESLLSKLQLPNALRFAIESAYIHLLCHADQTDIYTFLGIERPGPLATSFSLPIMDPAEIPSFYAANGLSRFQRLKIKVNAEQAVDLIREINQVTRQPLIVDGNEAWKDPDAVLRAMEHLSDFQIALIEQPMPAAATDAYQYLKPRFPYLLFADESICADADFEALSKQFHGVNMKLMKAGGYLNGLRILNEARKQGMKTMVGCMVETSLGISSAMHLCAGVDVVDLDGSLIIKNEPFGLMRESDGLLTLSQ